MNNTEVNSNNGPQPDVVRGRVPRWLHVGGVQLLGGEPTVKRTVLGLAEPGCTSPLGPAGASGVGNNPVCYYDVHVLGEKKRKKTRIKLSLQSSGLTDLCPWVSPCSGYLCCLDRPVRPE